MNDKVQAGREFVEMICMDQRRDNAAEQQAGWEAAMPYLTEQRPPTRPVRTASPTPATRRWRRRAAGRQRDRSCASAEVFFFTGGGTRERQLSARWHKSAMRASEKGRHLIISAIEHRAGVLHSAKALWERENSGDDRSARGRGRRAIAPGGGAGPAIRPDAVLVYRHGGRTTRSAVPRPLEGHRQRSASVHGVVFHTDAVQAFGHRPLNV
ncbi:MAG: hypothetical protein ACLVB5_05200 [Christensenellales bacterium]